MTGAVPYVEGWRDLRMPVLSGRFGVANAPSLSSFGSTGSIEQLQFALDNRIWISGHIDHDIKPGSQMYPHVHWSTDGTSTNTVKWELRWIMAEGHNTANFGAEVTIALEEAAQGTAWRHMVTEDTVGITAPEPDTLWIAELRRVTNGGTNNTDAVFGLFVDIHYQVQQYATPYRLPNFYTGP